MQIGLCPLLGALFIGLKLLDVIAWSWWLVTLPIWLPMAIIPIVMVGGLWLATRR